MMRRTRKHETENFRKIAGSDPAVFSFAHEDERVLTVDGPGVVTEVLDGPYQQTESYVIELDNGAGSGEYTRSQVLEVLPQVTTARRYSQTPMACDNCGCPASKSTSGGKGGHTMLCPDCLAQRQNSDQVVSSRHGADAEDRVRGRDPHARGDRSDRIGGHLGRHADRSGDPGVRTAGRRGLAAANKLTVTVTKEGLESYNKLDKPARSQILKVIKSFQRTGYYADTKLLRDYKPPTYRLRNGDLRVIYLRNGNHITIIKVGYRGQLGWSESSLRTAAAGFSQNAYEIWNTQIKPKLGPQGARWVDRVCDMLQFSFLAGHESGLTPDGYGNYETYRDPVMKGIRVLRVAKDWPAKGSIIVEREDGARIRLYLQGTKFRTEIMRKGDLTSEAGLRQGATQGEGRDRTAARTALPLLSPEELASSGIHTAADDYPELSEILWERPDWVEAEPVDNMPRRISLGSHTAASKKKKKPVVETNPIKEMIADPDQPWWWRKIVGPSLDRFNDSIPPDKRINTIEDLHRIPAKQWCRFRRDGECYYPKENDPAISEEMGFVVWIPFNRGECPFKTHEQQKNNCTVSEPGPNSGERMFYPDATVSWERGGQRRSSLQETPVQITSKWTDVRSKAKRIRQSGGVRVIAVTDNSVTGEIRGDTGLYTSTVTLVPGSSQVGLATCSCPWETYRWARSGPWKKLEGRACAHITALLYEMQSRKMFGGEIAEDVATPEWRTGEPELENPKSQPGEWRLDRAAALASHLRSITAQRDALESRALADPSVDEQLVAVSLAVEAMGLGHLPGQEDGFISLGELISEGATADMGAMDEVMAECAKGGYSFSGLVVKAADSGRVLMTQRTPYHGDDEGTYGKWEFPGGAIEEGENALEGALREFTEETGLELPAGWRVDGCSPNGAYLSILITVPNEAWTTDATLLSLETMGIGWFEVDHVEEEVGELTRPEMESTDWEMVKEATRSPLDEIAKLRAELAIVVAERRRNYKTKARAITRAILSLKDELSRLEASAQDRPEGIDQDHSASADQSGRQMTREAAMWNSPVKMDVILRYDDERMDEHEAQQRFLEGLPERIRDVEVNYARITDGLVDSDGAPVKTSVKSEINGADAWGKTRYSCPDHVGSGRINPASVSHPCDTCGSTTPAWTKKQTTSMFEARPDGEVLAQDDGIIYRRKSTLGDNGVEAWVGDTLVGVLVWSNSSLPIGKIDSVDVASRYQRRGVATKMFQLAKVLEPLLHHSHALTDDGEAWSKTVSKAAASDPRYKVNEHTEKHTHTDWSNNHDYCSRCMAPIVWVMSKRTGRNYPVNGTPALKKGQEVAGWKYSPVDFHKCTPDALERAKSIRERNAALDTEASSLLDPALVLTDDGTAEAILHDDPQPALPEALGAFDGDPMAVAGDTDPSLFAPSAVQPNTNSPRWDPDEPFEMNASAEPFVPGDARLAWLMEGTPQSEDGDIAAAASKVLSKMALKDFSIEEQNDLIHEGAEDHRGARNTDRLSIAGTHYEGSLESDNSSDMDAELLW